MYLFKKYIICRHDFLQSGLPAPGNVRYREEIEGKLDSKEIEKHIPLLQGLRKFKTHFKKLQLASIIEQVAADKEDSWRLAAEKKKTHLSAPR